MTKFRFYIRNRNILMKENESDGVCVNNKANIIISSEKYEVNSIDYRL